MRKGFITVVFAAAVFTLIASHGAFAADAVKFGVVDLFKVLNESDAGKRAKADLETLIKSKQSSVDEKGKTIERLKGDLDKQGAILSSEAKRSKEEELERLIRDYQRIVSDSQTEVKKKENELTGFILSELRELLAKIGQEEHFTLIMENAGGVVLFYAKTIDITDRVIKRYDESKKKK